MPICQFSVKFSLFKVDICFGKARNTIMPLQNLLESNFFGSFGNTTLARSFQDIFQCLLSQHCQPSTQPDDGAQMSSLLFKTAFTEGI